MPSVLVWDIETVPDLKGFAAAHGHEGKADEEIRELLGEKFPKHIFHSVVCIGALIARQEGDHWAVDALGAPHVGERSERELIAAFVNKIGELKPQLVTFNGSSFDLPVVRYRAMVHKVSAAGLSARQYFHRYTDDAVDLCDVLASFTYGGKATLHELCRVMGLPGKPDDIHGGEVDRYFREGRIREIADYSEGDVVNTYRLWLRYELFCGRLTDAGFEASEENLEEFIRKRVSPLFPRPSIPIPHHRLHIVVHRRALAYEGCQSKLFRSSSSLTIMTFRSSTNGSSGLNPRDLSRSLRAILKNCERFTSLRTQYKSTIKSRFTGKRNAVTV
jgi:3'-5' exonuclease